MTAREDSAGVVFPPPFLYAIPWLLGYLLHRWLGHDALPAAARPLTRPAGFAVVAVGLLIGFSGIATFLLARTTFVPHRPASALVTGGPYRFTRNPMYLGLAVVYLGLPLALGFAWPYLFFPVAVIAVDRTVIPKEEAYMERRFGDEFRRYKASVRRWV